MKTTDLTKLLLAAALPGAAAFGVIPVTDNFGIRGYVDGSYQNLDNGGTDTDSLKADNIDIDFLINTEKVSAEIHLAAVAKSFDTDGDGKDDLDLIPTLLEQAFLTLDLDNGISLTGGLFESLLGFEGDEQYKLYQQSTAYAFGSTNKDHFNKNYQQGVRASYKMDALSASVSFVDSVWSDDKGGVGNASDIGFEAFISYNAMQGLTLGLGTAQGDENETSTIDDYYNIWVQYDGIENLILAAEYNSYDVSKKDGDSWMVMGNYSFGNSIAATVRYSQTEEDGTFEGDKITISPSYSFTDNLLGVLEYSTGDQGEPNAQKDFDYFAVEALFTF
jgi:hypothetical protein